MFLQFELNKHDFDKIKRLVGHKVFLECEVVSGHREVKLAPTAWPAISKSFDLEKTTVIVEREKAIITVKVVGSQPGGLLEGKLQC